MLWKKETDEFNEKLDLSFVNKKWQEFIDSIHVKKPSLASILDKSEPTGISSSEITFKIKSALDFHLSQIENNRDTLNLILRYIFGDGVSFKVQKGIEKEDYLSENIIEKEENSLENDEQVRDKVVDLFDGEILT